VIGLNSAADTTVSNRLRKFLPAMDDSPGKLARASFFSGVKSDLSDLEGEQIKISFHIASCPHQVMR
jgi:hypothetical protein